MDDDLVLLLSEYPKTLMFIKNISVVLDSCNSQLKQILIILVLSTPAFEPRSQFVTPYYTPKIYKNLV